MFIRFDRIHERDGQTDGRTDKHRATASLDKHYAKNSLALFFLWPQCIRELEMKPGLRFGRDHHFASSRQRAVHVCNEVGVPWSRTRRQV